MAKSESEIKREREREREIVKEDHLADERTNVGGQDGSQLGKVQEAQQRERGTAKSGRGFAIHFGKFFHHYFRKQSGEKNFTLINRGSQASSLLRQPFTRKIRKAILAIFQSSFVVFCGLKAFSDYSNSAATSS